MIDPLVIWSFVLFIVLLLLEVPVPFAIASGSILYAFVTGENLLMFAQKMSSSFADGTMMAIPAFLFVGMFLNEVGLTDRVFRFAESWLGHITGGLAHANVLASMLFAGMSGSALADAGGLGVIEVETMRKAGYDEDFSVAVTAASSTIGPIIPPSINLLIWGYLSGTATLTLFIAALVPGLLMGAAMIAWNIIAIKFQHIAAPKTSKFAWKERLHHTWSALPALGGPAILIAGILSGAFTPSECGAVACIYCLIVGLCYKKLNLKTLLKTLKSTVSSSAMVMGLCATGLIFNWMIVSSGLLNVLSEILLGLASKALILLLLNIIMLVLGCFIGSMQILIILAPLLCTLCISLDISMVQMGVVAVFNLVIGLITPPLAPSLFVTCKATGTSFNRSLKYTCQFIIPLIIILLLITYFPVFTEGLPTLMGHFIK